MWAINNMKNKYHYIYTVIILGLLLSLFYLLLINKSGKSSGELADFAKQYPYIDPLRPLYRDESLIANIQPLRDYLKSLPEAHQDWAEISIYFEVLTTGSNISVNPDLKIWPASLSKLPVGMVAMNKVEKGEWSLTETKFMVRREDADLKLTPEVEAEIGKSFSLEFLLEKLLLESDNTAYNILVRQITPEEMAELPNLVGLEALIDPKGRMSAKDYSRLLRVLYLANYMNEDYSQKLLTLLDKSDFNGYLGAGMPEGVRFSHKWGTHNDRNVFADSGIVYLEDKPYMISVMVQGKGGDLEFNQKRADELMKEIGRKAYSFMNEAKSVE